MACTCVMSERPTSQSLKECEDHKHLYQPMVETLVELLREMRAKMPTYHCRCGDESCIKAKADPVEKDWCDRVDETLAKWRLG